MADDDRLADPTPLMPLPGPATSLATLDAATLAPGELAAAAKAAHTRRRVRIRAMRSAVAGVFRPGAVPRVWRMPRSTASTAGLAVGGSLAAPTR